MFNFSSLLWHYRLSDMNSMWLVKIWLWLAANFYQQAEPNESNSRTDSRWNITCLVSTCVKNVVSTVFSILTLQYCTIVNSSILLKQPFRCLLKSMLDDNKSCSTITTLSVNIFKTRVAAIQRTSSSKWVLQLQTFKTPSCLLLLHQLFLSTSFMHICT